MKQLIAGILLSYLYPCCADTLASPDKVLGFTDQILAQVTSGDLEGGLNLIRPNLLVPAAEFEAMAGQAKIQVPAMTQRYGKSIGAEFVREETVGDYLIRVTHVQRFEKHLMRWVFVFYRTPDGWALNTFNFDDDINAVFKG